MVLEESIKKIILAEYRQTNDLIYGILVSGENEYILDPDYLRPTTIGKRCDLNDESGCFRYYSKIREALESALTTGKIASELLPTRAPDYLVRLVKNDAPKATKRRW